MSTSLMIGERPVGDGHPCFVIAEAGVNHNGDVELAHDLIDAAADAGADAVKFQTFSPELLVSDAAEAAAYQRRNANATDQRTMLEALTLSKPEWSELAGHARDRELTFLSTGFDLASAEYLVELGVPALKVPSGELDNLPFVRALAELGLPLIISTGMGTLEEVVRARSAAEAAPGVAFLHCVTSYPTPPADCNLRAIATMRSELGVPVGWSDHTVGSVTAVAAVALGASLLEKHLTLSRSLPGPDHAASEEPAAFSAYVAAARETEAALGDGEKRPMPAEIDNRVLVRRSLHAARALTEGELLGPDDVLALRPAEGLPPDTAVEGRRVTRDVEAGTPLGEGDIA